MKNRDYDIIHNTRQLQIKDIEDSTEITEKELEEAKKNIEKVLDKFAQVEREIES